MSSKPAKASRNWLEGLTTQPGSSPLLGKMSRQGIPLTRENYIKEAYPELEDKELPTELEYELPKQFRLIGK